MITTRLGTDAVIEFIRRLGHGFGGLIYRFLAFSVLITVRSQGGTAKARIQDLLKFEPDLPKQSEF
jgi:hypothetical protein